MRLRASGDRHEIRQQYLPVVWQKTVAALVDGGKDVVPEVIDFMDSYYLTRDDFDAIKELGVGPMMESDKTKIDTATKAAFTRLYNSQNHPMPFIKASNIGGFSKLGSGGKKEKPDLEEAIDDDDGDMVEGDAKQDDEDDELDLKKDKYVKAPKKKAAAKASTAKGKAKGKGKGKNAADENKEDEENEDGGFKDESDEDVKPKKSGGARGGKKGKGKS
jgi:replication factor C subunit 1